MRRLGFERSTRRVEYYKTYRNIESIMFSDDDDGYTFVKEQSRVPSNAFAEDGSGDFHLETSDVKVDVLEHI